MIDFERLANPGIRRLRAYDPGHDLVALRHRFGTRLVELGSNENPLGASPKAKQAVADALDRIHVYPDPLGGGLKRALAACHGVETDSLLLGNGSHELLMQIAQVFAGPGDEIVASEFGFAVYALAAQAAGAVLRQAPALPREHPCMPRGHDLAALQAAIGPRTKLVYLANPNNPTGTWYGAEAFAGFLRAVPEDVIVVVDEAYAELADAPDYASALGLLQQHRNLVVTRTFSKAYGLAGLRVGYAMAHPALVAVVDRVRESFNVNAVGLAAAQAALGDAEHLAASVAGNASQRSALARNLRERGWSVAPSQTNFLLVEFGADAARLEAGLVERGVVVRPMGGYGLGECLRITVGTAHNNARLLEALDALR